MTETKEIPKISCEQRTVMLLCPCKYLRNPPLASSDCCLCCHETPLDDLISIPPLIQMGGTLMSSSTIPGEFVIIRGFLTLCMIYILILSLGWFVYYGNTQYWFIYFSMWTVLICTILMITKFVSTYKVYQLSKGKDQTKLTKQIDSNDPLWKFYIAQSILLQTALPAVSMVILNYYMFVCTWKWISDIDMIDSLQIHGANGLILWLDFLLSAERMYYKGCVWPILFATIYTIWSIIFELFIGVNEEGDPYIYAVYDWSAGLTTPIIIYSVSIIVLIIFDILATFIKNIVLICSNVGKFKFDAINNQDEDDTDDQTSDDALL